MKKNSFDPENQAGSERGTVMNRLFDTSVNVGLRQFYVLGAAGSIGNLLDLLEMCIFMDSVRRRFFVPCVHWSYLE